MPTAIQSGWFEWSTLWLLAQALAAVVSMRLFRMRVAPNVLHMRDGRAAADSLGPLALASPMIAGAFRTDWQIGGNGGGIAGWITLGAPVACGLLALGIAAIAVRPVRSDGDSASGTFSISPMSIAAWTFAGAVLLLLGAAHDLTIWAGQCAFAAGAVMLWINTPDLTGDAPSPADSQAGNGLTLMLLCSAVQALAIGFAPQSMLNISGGMAIAHAAMIFALAARIADPSIAMRLGGWTATLAILLGLGAISLRHMIPRAVAVLHGSTDRPPLKVAYGFGEFALEATIMLVLGAMALGTERIPSPIARRLIGGALLLGAALLAGWRLSDK